MRCFCTEVNVAKNLIFAEHLQSCIQLLSRKKVQNAEYLERVKEN